MDDSRRYVYFLPQHNHPNSGETKDSMTEDMEQMREAALTHPKELYLSSSNELSLATILDLNLKMT